MVTIDMTLGSSNLTAIAPESIVAIECFSRSPQDYPAHVVRKDSEFFLNSAVLVKDHKDSKVIGRDSFALGDFISKHLHLQLPNDESSIAILAKELVKNEELLEFFLGRVRDTKPLNTLIDVAYSFDTSGYIFICYNTLPGVNALIREMCKRCPDAAPRP
jgi:hypothetical protein